MKNEQFSNYGNIEYTRQDDDKQCKNNYTIQKAKKMRSNLS